MVGEILQDTLRVFDRELSKAFIVGERKLVGSAFDVIDHDEEVVGINAGMLGGLTKKIVGVLNDELIQGIGPGDKHGDRVFISAAGAS